VSFDLLAALTFLAVFVVGSVTRVNIGALGLVAAFLLGTFALGEDATTIASAFPASFFVLILGVTYLFSVASANGTIGWLLRGAHDRVQGRALGLPVALFLASAGVSALGAPAQAGVVLFAPLGIRLGKEIGLPPFVPAIAVVLGVTGGSFSPLNILALIANGGLQSNGLPVDEFPLMLASVATTAAIAAVVIAVDRVRSRRSVAADAALVTVGGRGAPARSAGIGAPAASGEDAPRGSIRTYVITLAGFAVVLLASIVFRLDLGFAALAVAVVLHLLHRRADAMNEIAWDVILLACGLMTLIGVLDRAGTLDRVSETLTGFGSPLLATLMLCFAAALVSAFASSTATIGTSVVLLVPLAGGVDGVGVLGATIAICLSSTLVDASPLSSVGALSVASAPKEDAPRLYRQLLFWGFSMILVAPLLTWSLFVWLPALLF
jgi:di/tricarboxylate transporter